MNLENDSLQELFDKWNILAKSLPTDGEVEIFGKVIEYTINDPQYISEKDELEYFNKWRDKLPAYYRQKTDVMEEILKRLGANDILSIIVSEITEDIPQFAYFLFIRHIELFILNDPLGLQTIRSSQEKPKWQLNLLERGLNLEEIDKIAKQVAGEAIGKIFSITDGSGGYGDLPENAPRPRIIESYLENNEQKIRYLMAIHEFMDRT